MTRAQRLSAIIASFVVLVGLFVTACHYRRRSDDQKKLTKIRVRLKWSHQAQFAGFYVAQQRGFYRENGLDVLLLPGIQGSGETETEKPAIQMVASGEDDFGLTGPESILLARGKGLQIKAIAAIFQDSPFCYIALKSENILRLRQLVGQPVGVHFDSPDILTYRAMLKGATPPIRETQVKEVSIPLDGIPSLVGQYDAATDRWKGRQVKAIPGYLLNEPIRIKRDYKLDVNIIDPAAYQVHLFGDTLFTTEEYARDHSDIVECFVAATIRGWREALRDPDAAVNATIEVAKRDQVLDRELERQKMQAVVGLIQKSEVKAQRVPRTEDQTPYEFGAMTYEKWKTVQRLTEERLEASHVDLTQVFTNEYLPEHRSPIRPLPKCKAYR